MRMSQAVCSTVLAILAVAGVNAAEIDEDGGHLKIEDPARVGDPERVAIYQKMRDQMVGGYALSQYPAAKGYTKWRLYNSAPYLSATHGNRYVNNYANARAGDYGSLAAGARLPAGSVLAKDSFTITSEDKVFPGALFVMEKLADGASPDNADWRYVMIMPDGSLFGDSMGDGAEEMVFCHACHKVKANKDYLYFVPKKYRRE
ncbi:MAG: hypothetical protein HKN11_17860 [Rhizobiales bacterium]|nr:hypothetical protein [Hyphomicrobiales bacterium]